MIKKLINNLFGTKPEAPVIKEQKTKKTPKEVATDAGEPWVEVIGIAIDKDNPGAGSFELDWNEKFIADLVRHGYMMNPNDTDADIVDRWFTTVCRNIVLETYEQEQAINPNRVVKSRDIGDGRSEVS
jgi:hypothetical protein